MLSKNRKAKAKKQKKYISIMLVPHSQENIKVFKISAFYLKSSIILVAITLLIISLFSLNYYLSQQKQSLESNLSKMTQTDIEQKNMLKVKASEIQNLMERDASIKERINDFTQKYIELTNSYLSDPSSKTSRSGDRTERGFVDDIRSLKSSLDSIKEMYDMQKTTISSLDQTQKKLEKYISTIPTLWPSYGSVSSTFGGRSDPFNFSEKFHTGLDFAADYGTDVLASASGTVIMSDYYGGYGNAIIISHGQGITTLYGHNSELLVGLGQTVKKGQLIARVGSSGRSTGPHLHFEVRINDQPVDPINYLDKRD